ncbi:hypothetical protein ACETRX_09465 [Labrys portucalensis]|uniref:Uncharacterized protein n=1 Tax=Labrys neptuniae TaxID=376174 RepID=A0ABV3PKG8_9HYPH
MFFKRKKSAASDGPATEEQIAGIFDQIMALGPGDLSTLEGVSRDVGNAILTLEDSPNGRLWSAMTALGWAAPEAFEIPDEGLPRLPVKSFKLLPAGKEPVSQLLEKCFAEHAARPRNPLHEQIDMCNDFIARLREHVIIHGGGMQEFVGHIAFVAAKTVHTFANEENKNDVLRKMFDISGIYLSKMREAEDNKT